MKADDSPPASTNSRDALSSHISAGATGTGQVAAAGYSGEARRNIGIEIPSSANADLTLPEAILTPVITPSRARGASGRPDNDGEQQPFVRTSAPSNVPSSPSSSSLASKVPLSPAPAVPTPGVVLERTSSKGTLGLPPRSPAPQSQTPAFGGWKPPAPPVTAPLAPRRTAASKGLWNRSKSDLNANSAVPEIRTSSSHESSPSESPVASIAGSSTVPGAGGGASGQVAAAEALSNPNKPLTYKDADGFEWFLRGSVGKAVEPVVFEPSNLAALPTNAVVDRYGFLVDSENSRVQEEGKLAQLREEKMLRKWRAMIGTGGAEWKAFLKKRPREVKRRIRKGVPDCLRGLVWQLISGSRELLLINQGVYEQLVFYETSNSELDIIRDINRTFPSHVFFQQRHGPGQRSLYNVLKAYSVYDKEVGYVQGMGFLAGLLLLYMGEEDAFWLLVALLKGAVHDPMEGLYLTGLPLVQQYLWQFSALVKEQMPRLGNHLEEEMVNPSMYASQWFITVFSYSFPFSTALRIWDVFLFEGMGFSFRVGLALLKSCHDDLVEQPFEVLVHSLRNFPESSLQPETLLPLAFSFKVSKRLQELKLEYDAIHNPAPRPERKSLLGAEADILKQAAGVNMDVGTDEGGEDVDDAPTQGLPPLNPFRAQKAAAQSERAGGGPGLRGFRAALKSVVSSSKSFLGSSSPVSSSGPSIASSSSSSNSNLPVHLRIKSMRSAVSQSSPIMRSSNR
eukprot:TRINITY_DN12888_c0_g1_i1.p1 TRINITY_DN12888_c0_g1~~TRINITY_DN12888_c0_g1_i1.p1  ORF type:complete len:737 (+),score=109.50 TRINITY_DN12888_c0_g1_i1:307-2517(+)